MGLFLPDAGHGRADGAMLRSLRKAAGRVRGLPAPSPLRGSHIFRQNMSSAGAVSALLQHPPQHAAAQDMDVVMRHFLHTVLA